MPCGWQSHTSTLTKSLAIFSESVYEDCPCQIELDNELNNMVLFFLGGGMVDRFRLVTSSTMIGDCSISG